MHSPRCSTSPDIFHVNSCKAGVTHSCCCMLQCVHYSMERRDAELISMATGLNDRTRVKENLELASRSLPEGCSCIVLRLSGSASLWRVCEAGWRLWHLNVIYLRVCCHSQSGGGADVCSSGSGCRQDGGCSDSPHRRGPSLTHVAMAAGAA